MNKEEHLETLRRQIIEALEAISCNPCCSAYPKMGEFVRDLPEGPAEGSPVDTQAATASLSLPASDQHPIGPVTRTECLPEVMPLTESDPPMHYEEDRVPHGEGPNEGAEGGSCSQHQVGGKPVQDADDGLG